MARKNTTIYTPYFRVSEPNALVHFESCIGSVNVLLGYDMYVKDVYVSQWKKNTQLFLVSRMLPVIADRPACFEGANRRLEATMFMMRACV